MHGNVSEWVWDYYGENDTALDTDPTGLETGMCRIYRGGGRFGQSFTAITKLAKYAVTGEPLSVYYSGDNSLTKDIADWLKINRMHTTEYE